MYSELCKYQVCIRSIPSNICEALTAGGFVLIIKGKAGSGKSTFSLELTRVLPSGSVILVTTRESPSQIITNHPWLLNFLPKNNIMDGRAARVLTKETYPKIATNDIFNFLKNLYNKIETLEAKPVTVIIDSIDALKTAMGIKWDDFSIEKSLFDITKTSNINLVLVVERFDVIQLDYLADGVVELEHIIKDGRTLRLMKIKKIRGKIIPKPEYVYTLKEGRFQFFSCIDNPTKLDIEKQQIVEETPHVSSGVSRLDKILGGGYKLGSFNVIEVEENVNDSLLISFLSPMIKRATKTNTLVYMIPPAGLPPSKIIEQLSEYKELKEAIETHLKFLIPKVSQHVSENNLESVYKLEKSTLAEVFEESENVIADLLKEIGTAKHIGIVGADILEYKYGYEELKDLLGIWVSTVKALNRVEIVFVKSLQRIAKDIFSMSSTHFILESYNGTILFYGVKPWTMYYAITTTEVEKDGEKEFIVKLEPIV